ncbi:MAG: hypothetical protein QXH30_00565 [Candidatus Bilamarchaeaceae archaeon]
MGLFDWLSGKKEEPSPEMPAPGGGSVPFKIATKFTPMRLQAHKDSKLTMNVVVQNVSGAKQLVSVDLDIAAGNRVGFEVTCSKRHLENRLGELAPGASKEINATIYGNSMTNPGEVGVKATAYAHYQDYNKVQAKAVKAIKLRIV